MKKEVSCHFHGRVDPDVLNSIIQDLVMKAGEIRFLAAHATEPMCKRLEKIGEELGQQAVKMAEWMPDDLEQE